MAALKEEDERAQGPMRAPPPKQPDAPVEVQLVAIKDLLGTYKDKARGDNTYKGKRIEITGCVSDVKKGLGDEIYVTVGTGQAFEFPVVQCFISKGQESKAASLSKGKQITVRGQVDGLLMNVLLKDCEINSLGAAVIKQPSRRASQRVARKAASARRFKRRHLPIRRVKAR
jgi:hypothetical protein